MTEQPLAAWLQAACQAADELATTMLGFSQLMTIDCQLALDGLPEAAMKVALVGDPSKFHVGIVADAESGQALSRALLGMDPEDELEDADIDDSLGEIANMLAGGVKTRIDQSLTLNVPVVHNNLDDLRKAAQLGLALVHCDDVPVKLFVVLV